MWPWVQAVGTLLDSLPSVGAARKGLAGELGRLVAAAARRARRAVDA